MPQLPVALTLAIALAGCTLGAEHAGQNKPDAVPVATAATMGGAGASTQPSAAAGEVAAVPRTIAAMRDTSRTPVVRALYVNRFAAQSHKRMRWLLGVADSTEINGLVIDMKDEFGLNYRSANPDFRRNAGSGSGMVHDVAALLDSVHAHGVFAIARIVVFKDPVTAAANPAWTIRRPDGSEWRDKKGVTWVDPYNRAVWEYDIGVAEELVKLGFDEIQFDYIRYPEPFKSLPPQVFPAAQKGVSKAQNLAVYLKEARERLHKLGVRETADIFGLVTTVRGPLEVGQDWEKISPNVDVVLPMVYPSHYPHGSFGIPAPNADPYRVMRIALDTARVRDVKLGITAPNHVRPWLQAFSLGKPEYGAPQLELEKKAAYDAGDEGWVMWNPGSKYEAFLPGLARKGAAGAATPPAADTTRH